MALWFAYVVPNLPEFNDVSYFLNAKSSRSLSITHVANTIADLQAFIRNRLYVRWLTRLLAATKKRKVDLHIYNSANCIQRCIRGFLGRRRIVRIAQAMYTKFLDGETDREYWCNTRTGNSFWTKPVLLGRFDCGMATRMPKQDEVFQVTCQVCNELTATW
jgi:hypothetical protein